MTLAQRVFIALRPLELCDIPAADVKERLSLLTVAGLVRRVGAIGFAEDDNQGALKRLRDHLVNCGLHNRITVPPLAERHHLLDQFPHDVVEVSRELDIEDHRKAKNRLLWVYTDEADSERIQTWLANKEMIGTILGYPECCVKRHTERFRIFAVAFLRAIVDKVGTDPKKVRTALRDELKVEVPAEIVHDPNMFRTDQRYPFLLHIACDSCLQDDHSPSSRMNAENEAFALDLDPEFRRSVSDIVALSCEKAKLWGMDTLSPKEALTAEEQERLADLRNRSRQIVQRLRG